MSEKYHMVNWIDGMKIRKQHFVEQQHAVSQLHMQGVATQLNAINYGLLPPLSEDSSPSFKLDMKIEKTNTIHVKIYSCKAATPGGFLIDLGNENGQPRHFTRQLPDSLSETEQEERYMLVICADPFDFEEVGEPDPGEIPPRRPYIEPTYQLGLLPKQNAGEGSRVHNYGLFAVCIGEIIVHPSNIYMNEQYIPPCMAVCSTPSLIDIHTRFHQSLCTLETLCIRIVKKILAKEKQKFMLAVNVLKLSQDILSYLGPMLYRFNSSVRHAPPVKMFECIAGLGRLIKNSMDIRHGTGKEELINYFVEWCDLNQGQFESVVSRVVDHVYDHTNISEMADYCSHFLEEMTGLYAKLDELDYIGRKSGKDIFVKEDKRNPARKKNRINFLAQ